VERVEDGLMAGGVALDECLAVHEL
jgi:hypothetical protein